VPLSLSLVFVVPTVHSVGARRGAEEEEVRVGAGICQTPASERPG
jgi:hypothetical protein